jgi:hypothetical protein
VLGDCVGCEDGGFGGRGTEATVFDDGGVGVGDGCIASACEVGWARRGGRAVVMRVGCGSDGRGRGGGGVFFASKWETKFVGGIGIRGSIPIRT